uniref:Williams-Beuren syndrome chromosomal region 16-like protein n=1 Tax=Syphacia muris TaxID=451379 RepID=A0A0N5AY71_9BILA
MNFRISTSANVLINVVRYGSSHTNVYGAGLVASGSLFSMERVKAANNHLLQFRKPTNVIYFLSKNIQKIAAGFGFSVFASKDRLYGGGVNIFSNDIDPTSANDADYWRRGRSLPIDSLSDEIIGISAGRRHFLVGTKSEVYAFGDNAHGQCGFDPAIHRFLKLKNLKSCKIDLPSKSPVKQVHCTLDTSFILLESGELYSFGLGTDGQLGRSAAVRDWHCLPVECNFDGSLPIAISGSTDTLCLVTEAGSLFMWGQNEYEQMSLFTNEIQVTYPIKISLGGVGKIVAADTTATSCIILNSAGEVYTWGFGVIGHGPIMNSLKRPMQLHSNLFIGCPTDQGKVQKIFAGNTSMFALTKENALFGWGINRFSHIGLDNDKDQYFPRLLSLYGTLVDLSVAPDHTLFLTK